MKKLALLFGLLFAFPVFAADNAVIVTPGTGVTMKSKDIGAGVQAMQPVLSDTGGNALSMPTAGADGVSNTATGLLGYSRNLVFNGTTWDRWQGAVTVSGVATSALQTTANTKLDTIITNTGAAIPAGSANIGGVELIDSAGTNKAAISAAGAIASNTAQVNGVTVLAGTGASGTGAQRVTVSTDQATNAGAALVKGGVGVVNGGSTYQAVAASATATVLQTSTGAIGDYLSHCDIYPTSTSPGVVTVFDNANAAATNVIAFPGGASSVSNLVPFPIPVGAVSTAGAWKVTTGANVSVVCYGKFS